MVMLLVAFRWFCVLFELFVDFWFGYCVFSVLVVGWFCGLVYLGVLVGAYANWFVARLFGYLLCQVWFSLVVGTLGF